MDVRIASEIYEYIPDFKIGFIQYQDISVGDSPQMVKGRLQLHQESLFFELEDKKVTDFPGIQEWRQVFKKIGKDPNRYRHSAEALYRRVQKQNYLKSIHSATDLNNFFSLQYQIPFGIYDVEKIKGDLIAIRIGAEGEEYLGLNGRENSLNRLLLSADETGPFGSPFVDSERTAVTEKTKQAVQIVYLKPSMPVSEAERLIASVANMFTQISGGSSEFKVL